MDKLRYWSYHSSRLVRNKNTLMMLSIFLILLYGRSYGREIAVWHVKSCPFIIIQIVLFYVMTWRKFGSISWNIYNHFLLRETDCYAMYMPFVWSNKLRVYFSVIMFNYTHIIVFISFMLFKYINNVFHRNNITANCIGIVFINLFLSVFEILIKWSKYSLKKKSIYKYLQVNNWIRLPCFK